MYGLVGEKIQWDTPTGVLSGEIMFTHVPEDVEYYSIATGPKPMDRHFLDSDSMSTMNVVNLSR